MKKRAWILSIVFVLCLAYFAPNFLLQFSKCLLQNHFENAQTDFIRDERMVVLNSEDYVSFGTYQNEPIIWKVVSVESDGKILLISDKIICFKAFDSCGENNYYHPTEDIKTFGSSEWKECTLNEWLNSPNQTVVYSHCSPSETSVYGGFNAYDNESGFLCKSNFNNEQKAMISEEGVFIPSKSMLEKHIKTNKLKKECTIAAIVSDNSSFLITPNKPVWYWTSTAFESNNVSVTAVTSSGTFYKTLAYDSTMGVCPALYLKTNVVLSLSGTGSEDNPYIIYGGEMLEQ